MNRRTAYATVGMVLAAEFPDIDTLWGLRGPVTGFQHHRGITHSFAGIPLEAAFLLLVLYLYHLWHGRRTRGLAQEESLRRILHEKIVPMRPAGLYGCLCLALLSHLFLDWTNNYGVRPLAPFNSRWHAASLLFIFDPLVFLLLIAALTLPALFRLIRTEIGDRRKSFAAEGWAAAALASVALLLVLRAVEHTRAVDLALAESVTVTTDPTGLIDTTAAARLAEARTFTARSALASPDPFNPFLWHVATDFGPFMQLEEVNARRGTVDPQDELLYKPARTPLLQAAEASPLGRVYLDWSPLPLLAFSGGGTEGGPGGEHAIVIFRDPRFMGNVPLLNRDGSPPLTGTVELSPTGELLEETFGGKEQPLR